jgi:hypothetical protein
LRVVEDLRERGENQVGTEIETTTPKILAFPNPTDGILKLSFYDTNKLSETPHIIQVFNTTGGESAWSQINELKELCLEKNIVLPNFKAA